MPRSNGGNSITHPSGKPMAADGGAARGNGAQVTAGDGGEDAQPLVDAGVEVRHLGQAVVRELLGRLNAADLGLELLEHAGRLEEPVGQPGEEAGRRLAPGRAVFC